MFDFLTHADLSILTVIFLVAAGVITFAGTKLARVAEDIASQTGWGQAIVGAVFIGISTSLSGSVLSIYAAAENHPSLAISNSIGGIAAQTVFLAIADLTYRKVNLEHAAASLVNMAQSALLIILLSIPLIALTSPDLTFFKIHPASAILLVGYLAGLKVIAKTKKEPMWQAKQTYETQTEKKSESHSRRKLRNAFILFVFLAAVLGSSGFILAEAATALSARTGLSESIIGGFLTSVTTSLPELVTALAAVRRGALNLAVGDIIGGNSFDVLFLVGADLFFRQGSLYHQFETGHVLMLGMTMLMTGVLTLGMLRRERVGPAGIGFESMLLLLLYGLLVILMIL